MSNNAIDNAVNSQKSIQQISQKKIDSSVYVYGNYDVSVSDVL